MAQENKIRIGYWKIRGLAAPLRMIMVYLGKDFDDVMYELQGSPGNWDGTAWFAKDKPDLLKKNPLMNLPYVIDGETVITQSNACFLYLGRKFNLNGKNEDEIAKNDQCLCEVMDLRNDAVRLFYSPQSVYDADVEKYFEGSLVKHLEKFERWLESQKTDFLVSNEPTVSDFHLFELLQQNEELAQSLGKTTAFKGKFPYLTNYYQKFGDLPGIKKYYEGPYNKIPINNKMAAFGSTC
eukprot:CAMPEP_0201489716 /NCGR_PEP_ID=MMETSP0151_2-20130828/23419_1 /ASSEMBLY_ACC=CAM_ASM_000257 /TAXON_ID=200890 /ORGANISM="Paramoeba atlantica, Strain 621/1 / CCAP 1560/9" /LENGTH=237 /DNA_ID=CAMNT_0047875399 /DNA_START=37 /DNA_END=750 /DNA_ORIENTATION=+